MFGEAGEAQECLSQQHCPPRWSQSWKRGQGSDIKDKDRITGCYERPILVGNYFQVNPFAVLLEVDDLEQVVRARIALRSKHSHEAFGGNVRCVRRLAELGSRIYVITQNRFACIYVTS